MNTRHKEKEIKLGSNQSPLTDNKDTNPRCKMKIKQLLLIDHNFLYYYYFLHSIALLLLCIELKANPLIYHIYPYLIKSTFYGLKISPKNR